MLELPHVLENVPGTKDDTFQFVASDMMDFIPPADAVLLKVCTSTLPGWRAGAMLWIGALGRTQHHIS